MTEPGAAAPSAEPIDMEGTLQVPKAAAWLGVLGLVPFVVGAIMILTVEVSWAYDALRYYAATILAFMGGVQWGLAMAAARDQAQDRTLWLRLSASVAPALIAWLALLLSAPFDLVVIALAFGLLLLSDLSAARQGWAPAWYPGFAFHSPPSCCSRWFWRHGGWRTRAFSEQVEPPVR